MIKIARHVRVIVFALTLLPSTGQIRRTIQVQTSASVVLMMPTIPASSPPTTSNMKIKRILYDPDRLIFGAKDSDEALDFTNDYCVSEVIVDSVTFEDEDGKFYTIRVNTSLLDQDPAEVIALLGMDVGMTYTRII